MPTAQVLLTRDDLRARQRFLNARNTFAELLQWRVLPIVNENDTVSVSELKFGDNDCLASLLVNLTGADLFVNLTSSPGVLAANPQRQPDAPVMDHIDDVAALDLSQLCGGKTSVGTGGMYSKLLAARRAAQIGVPTLILPGREPDVLARVFDAAALEAAGGTPTATPGTWVRPAGHAIPRRKFWLAYQSEPAGNVTVDAGAAQALLRKGGSLLPGGVRREPWCACCTRGKAWAWAFPITARLTLRKSWGSSATKWRPFWATPTIRKSSTGTICCWTRRCRAIHV